MFPAASCTMHEDSSRLGAMTWLHGIVVSTVLVDLIFTYSGKDAMSISSWACFISDLQVNFRSRWRMLTMRMSSGLGASDELRLVGARGQQFYDHGKIISFSVHSTADRELELEELLFAGGGVRWEAGGWMR